MKTENKIQNNILVRIIGIQCIYEHCTESSKFHYKDSQLLDDGSYKEFDVYLCEKHYNKINNNTNKQFRIIVNEQSINKYNINSEFNLGNRFLPTILTKPKLNKNWKSTGIKESNERIQLYLARSEINLMGDNEALKIFYEQNKHQFKRAND